MKNTSILFIVFILLACNNKAPIQEQQAEYPKTEKVNDSVKYEMFCEAFKYDSTAPYFIVFTVKNKNTNEIKEVCTQSALLEGALQLEMKKDFSTYIDMSQFKDRYFEFANKQALNNISFYDYDSRELDSLRLTFNVDSFMSAVKNNTAELFTFGRGNVQKMTAHLLFDYGVVLSRGCVAGNISGFAVYDPNNANWMWN